MEVIAPPKSKALDLYLATKPVIGQEIARQELATLLARQWEVHQGKYERSGGALLAGNSGTGKSFAARMMCQHLGLPFAECDATRYTEQGYKGLDLQHMFLPLLEAAAELKDQARPLERSRFNPQAEKDWVVGVGPSGGLVVKEQDSSGGKEPTIIHRDDIEEVVKIAQTGVILLDEFDKWTLRINHVTGEKDKAIQSELLKLIEGSKDYVSNTDMEMGVRFDTSRVLIICAGAFVGLFQQVGRRLGLDAEELNNRAYLQQEQFWSAITPEDFEKFGLLPELAGRLSRHIFTRPLQTDSMRTILVSEGGVLDEYRKRYESHGCEWGIGDAGILTIVAAAMRLTTGARALDFMCDKMLGGRVLFQASTTERRCRVRLEPNWPRAQLEYL